MKSLSGKNAIAERKFKIKQQNAKVTMKQIKQNTRLKSGIGFNLHAKEGINSK